MRPFEGFVRKAVVIVPTDEEFKRRVAQREQEEGKDVPDTAVLEMKGNPDRGINPQLTFPSLALSCHSHCHGLCPPLLNRELVDLLQRHTHRQLSHLAYCSLK
jgi:hypothetical protein